LARIERRSSRIKRTNHTTRIQTIFRNSQQFILHLIGLWRGYQAPIQHESAVRQNAAGRNLEKKYSRRFIGRLKIGIRSRPIYPNNQLCGLFLFLFGAVCCFWREVSALNSKNKVLKFKFIQITLDEKNDRNKSCRSRKVIKLWCLQFFHLKTFTT
jgi:hypothetical protein